MFGLLTGGFSKYIMMGLAAVILVMGIMLGLSKLKVANLQTEVSNLQQEIIVKKVQIKGLEGDIEIAVFLNEGLEKDNTELEARNKVIEDDNQNLLTTIEDLANANPDTVLDDFLNNR
jgi:hypothetical protein